MTYSRVRSRSVIWLLVFGGLAAAGVVALVVMALGVHKIDDVLVEVRMLGERHDELRALTAQVQLPRKHRE